MNAIRRELIEHFPRNVAAVAAAHAGERIKYGVRLDGDLYAEVAELVTHALADAPRFR